MVTVRVKYGRDQEFINSKIRPYKRRFPRGTIAGAKERMKDYGLRELRKYRPQIKFRFLIFIYNPLSQILFKLRYLFQLYY